MERWSRRGAPAGGIPTRHAEAGVLGNNLWPGPRRPSPPPRRQQHAAVGGDRRGVPQGDAVAGSTNVAAARTPGAGAGRMAVGLPRPLSALLHPGIRPARQLKRDLGRNHVRPGHHRRRRHGPIHRRLRPPAWGEGPGARPMAHWRSTSGLLQRDAVDSQRLFGPGLRAAGLRSPEAVVGVPAANG